jgi:hypothetical protein
LQLLDYAIAFPVKVFTTKGNLVFMNNLYHKVAVVSVCTARGFVLGASEEVKAAVFILDPTITFAVTDYLPSGSDGLGDSFYEGAAGTVLRGIYSPTGKSADIASLTEFNISNFSSAPNSFSRATLRTQLNGGVFGFGINDFISNPGSLDIFGYVGNGTAEISDFEAGVLLGSLPVSDFTIANNFYAHIDVTSFVNQRVSNGDAFAGFSVRALNFGGVKLKSYNSDDPLQLIIRTTDVAEPVPEPTTIFGSALALSLGGWLKRKKSSQQNKTTLRA